MFPFRKYGSRRAEIRKNLPVPPGHWKRKLMARDSLVSIAVAVIFCLAAFGILTLRDDVVRYRPGQFVAQDIYPRVTFRYFDAEAFATEQKAAWNREPRVYRRIDLGLADLQASLSHLPEQLAEKKLEQLPADLRSAIDAPALAAIQQYRAGAVQTQWNKAVQTYVGSVATMVILSPERRREEADRTIVAPPYGAVAVAARAYAWGERPENTSPGLATALETLAASAELPPETRPAIAKLTLPHLHPTYELDEDKTREARSAAMERVPHVSEEVRPTDVLVHRNRTIGDAEWRLLQEEQRQFARMRPMALVKSRLGMAAIVGLITLALAAYIAIYQPRIIRNHARAVALAALLLSMLLLAQLAGVGSGPLYIWGVAPTILVAMILATVYDQRFSMGIASMQSLLATIALDQGIGFFLILLVGARVCCLLLDDVRTRGKLIEVGGLTAAAMVLATAAVGAIALEPMRVIAHNCLYVGAAGLSAGFVVLGILPFIERAFRITTSVTLLEWADASQPLLRRLALEAPGTYNHSLQTATLAEEAAEVIGANSLLCRVGAYYHDIGKINKADYFCENQARGENRHINLSSSVSLLIIIGHVKDGMEMAREYNLPTALFPFIQQHHGTTLVEYFYHQACTQRDPNDDDAQAVSDSQYRYPGPRPRTREAAIVMLSDAVEGATRAMVEPTPARTETLVHELTMKRLHDGQFDECPLTFRELAMIERSMVKTILGIYHARMAYPSTMATTHGTASLPTAKTA